MALTKFLRIFVFILILPLRLAFAQIGEVVSPEDLKNLSIETNNIRIDPEWVKVYESNGYMRPQDVKTDKAGNIYSVGYFNYSFKANGQTMLPSFPTICKTGNCQGVYYLMKHDPKGNLSWTRYFIGNSGLVKIFFDKKGLTTLAGTSYSKVLAFSSADTTTFRLRKTNDQNLGIFLCKYDAAGKVVTASLNQELTGFEPKAYFLDGQENLIVGGNNYYSVIDPASNSQKSWNAITLLKLNNKLELSWQSSAEKKGDSRTESIYANQQGEIFVTGNFSRSLTLENTRFVDKDSSYLQGNLFIAKYNAQGKLLWVTNTVGKYRSGNCKAVVCDSKGNAYVYGSTTLSSGSSPHFLARLDNTGKPVWTQEIKGESNFIEYMVMDEGDNIYLTGHGLGAAFGSSGPHVYSYKEKKREGTRGYDLFLAKYSNQGLLEWLKAAGGQSSIYAKALAVHKNDLIAFGQSGGNLQFSDTVKVSKNGANFWLAKFSHQKLARIDTGPQKKSYLEATAKPAVETDKKACTCTKEIEKISGFSPSVAGVLPYRKFAEVTRWEEAGKETFYDYLYYTYFNTSYSTQSSAGGVTVFSYRPIRLLYPNKSFGVNFTPCSTGQNHSDILQLSFSFTHGIKGINPDYDHKTFDRTARAYFKVVMTLSHKRDREILDHALFNHTITDLNKFFAEVNKKYKTNIKVKKQSQEEILELVELELDKKNIRIEDFLFQEFVATANSGKGKITPTEAQRLLSLFPISRGFYTLDEIDRFFIFPTFRAMLSNKNLGIEISEKIIRQWDALQNEPAKNEKGAFIPANILLDVKNVICSTSGGLEAEVTGACITRSELTGTGILFNFLNASIIGSPDSYRFQARYSPSPLFILDSVNTDPEYSNRYTYRYDTLFTKFTGLSVPEAQFHIPFKTKTLTLKGKNLLLNNFMISGTLEIPVLPIQNPEPDKVRILVGEAEETTSLQELQAALKTLGLKHVKLVKERGYLKIHFKKTAFEEK